MSTGSLCPLDTTAPYLPLGLQPFWQIKSSMAMSPMLPEIVQSPRRFIAAFSGAVPHLAQVDFAVVAPETVSGVAAAEDSVAVLASFVVYVTD